MSGTAADRQAVSGSTPRVGGYVASHRTGARLGLVEAVGPDESDPQCCFVGGVWIPFAQLYPCEAPGA